MTAGPRFRATAATLSAALLVTACGASAYTKRDFIARASAICTSTLRKTRSVPPPASAQSPTALAAYVAKVAPLVQAEADQLHALPHPPGTSADRAALARYLAALEQTVRDYRKLAAAARRGDAQAMAASEAALRASPASSLSVRYGLSACGAPGSTAP